MESPPSSTGRSTPLRRVIPLARPLRCGDAVVNFLSIEDLLQEFVLRMAVLDPHHSHPLADWASANLLARDQHSRTYTGEVASAVEIPGGIDLAVSCWPRLDAAASILELTFGPVAWGVSLIAALDPGATREAPSYTGELELSVDAVRAVEVAEQAALRMGEPLGPEHLMLGIVRTPHGDEVRQTLQAVNLHESRLLSAFASLDEEPMRLDASELASALGAAERAATRLADVCVRPAHLLLGLLDERGTRVERALLSLGLPGQIVHRLLDAQLAARAGSVPEPSGRQLRGVVAVEQTQTSVRHALTLTSIEDYANGFVVRGHVDSSSPWLARVARQLKLTACDDGGRLYPCNVTATSGYGTGVGCSISVAWTSTSQLGPGARVLGLSAPDLGCSFRVPLHQGVRARHV